MYVLHAELVYYKNFTKANTKIIKLIIIPNKIKKKLN